jgi:flagellin
MVLGISSLDFSIQYSVQNAFQRLANVSVKLATLQRINRASDDPAGLIAMEELSNELSAVRAATESANRTRAFAQVADSALSSAGDLLTNIQTNLVAASSDTLSAEEREALQYEIDASLDALNRLGDATLGGRQIFGESAQFLVGTDPTNVETLTLPAVDDSLGGGSGVLADLRSGGTASVVSGDLGAAFQIVEEARSQLITARAEVGAFESFVVDSTQRVLQGMEVNLASALSSIRDADVAAETSSLVRETILSQTSVMTAKLLLRSRKSTAGLLTNLFDESE